jgi:hypothetical protein
MLTTFALFDLERRLTQISRRFTQRNKKISENQPNLHHLRAVFGWL